MLIDQSAEPDPLGAATRRKLHIVLLLDASFSMAGARIGTLNEAVRLALDELKNEAATHSTAEMLIRQCVFSDKAAWRSPWRLVQDYKSTWDYEEIEVSGTTSLGAALDLLTKELDPEQLGTFLYPPVIVLVTDGMPTDDWESALRHFQASPFGRKSSRTVRVAIDIVSDRREEGDELDVLVKFTGQREMVLLASSAQQLTGYLRYATVMLSRHSSKTSSRIDPQSGGIASTSLPRPPSINPDPIEDVW
ncbi:MAG: hypothetical protein RL033_2069 [Pseudomonadota bacterium]|jgi:uncharacterized protein YegL